MASVSMYEFNKYQQQRNAGNVRDKEENNTCGGCSNIGIDCDFCEKGNELVTDLTEEESKEIADLICGEDNFDEIYEEYLEDDYIDYLPD